MKSQNHKFQENRFLQTSKKSILYLGIALVVFTNTASALNYQQSSVDEQNLTQTTQSDKSFVINANDNDSIKKRAGKKGGNSTNTFPQVIVYNPNQKTMEEIIAENNQITESVILDEFALNHEASLEANQVIEHTVLSEIGSLCCEKTMEEIVKDDSQIIESSVLTEVQPINMKKSKKV